jgi:hypothetical protein
VFLVSYLIFSVLHYNIHISICNSNFSHLKYTICCFCFNFNGYLYKNIFFLSLYHFDFTLSFLVLFHAKLDPLIHSVLHLLFSIIICLLFVCLHFYIMFYLMIFLIIFVLPYIYIFVFLI